MFVTQQTRTLWQCHFLELCLPNLEEQIKQEQKKNKIHILVQFFHTN
jgi:hypothetical protein